MALILVQCTQMSIGTMLISGIGDGMGNAWAGDTAGPCVKAFTLDRP